MQSNNNPSFGALPPEESSWEVGKTAASIRFVREARVYLSDKPRVSPIVALEKYVEAIMSGKVVLTRFITVSEFMNSERIKSMG